MPSLHSIIDSHLPLSRPRRRYKRILLVDDDLVPLRLFTTTLENAGYEVVSCSSALAAVRTFQRWRFDLLMTDYEMSGMDGVTLANLLTGPSRKLSVLIISGAAVDEIPLERLTGKKWSFLPKRTRAAQLLATVGELCGLTQALVD